MNASRQIDALTSLRFFLAALVVTGHFAGHFPSVVTPSTAALFYNAPTAVSWFFVLSGYVIAYNYAVLGDSKGRRSFIIARFARLWPVHIITTLAMIALDGGGKYYPFFLSMTHTWTASPDMATAYNGPSWSISTELFFYVCYLGLAAPKRWVRFATATIPIILAISAMMSLHCYLPTGSDVPRQCSAMLNFWPPTRFLEFLAGVAIFRFGVRIPQIIGLAFAASFLTGYFPIYRGSDNPVISIYAFYVSSLICGGLLIASLSQRGWLSSLLSAPALVFGGEISYSMYMTHQIVSIVVLDYVKQLGMPAAFCVVFAATVLVSALLFLAVESPVRKAVKAWLRNGRSTHRDARAINRNVLPVSGLDPSRE